jgi:hypothetical protein
MCLSTLEPTALSRLWRGFCIVDPCRVDLRAVEEDAAVEERTGISNRESADEEAREREEFPPVDTGSPQPEDAAGRVGEDPLDDNRDWHTSHKAGSRSMAQKEAESRYPDRTMPPSSKVAGAFGKEPE